MIVFQRVIEDHKGQLKLCTQTHCGVISDDTSQDSNCVLALVQKSLQLYKDGHEEVTEAYLRSDNVRGLATYTFKVFLMNESANFKLFMVFCSRQELITATRPLAGSGAFETKSPDYD